MKTLHTLRFGVASAALALAADAGSRSASNYRRKEAENTHAELVKVKNDLAEQQRQIQKFINEVGEKALTPELKAAIEKSATQGTELVEKFAALEQKLAELTTIQTAAEKAAVASIRGQLEKDPAFVKFCEERGGKFRKEFAGTLGQKALVTDGTGGAGDLVQPHRVAGIITQPNRQLTIRDLLTVIPITSNAVEFVRETGFENKAAAVAEGETKPESHLSFSLESTGVKTIAHWIQASKQILDDVPALLRYIEVRMTYGLDVKEEDELLTGDGVGANLLGFLGQATPFDTSRTETGDTPIDTVRRAMTQVTIAEYRATGVLMHPNDWETIELTKTSEGAYVWANPAGLLGPRLWGLPVILTTALEPGEFVVGAFDQACTLWEREQTVIDISTDDRDNFIKNLVTIRAEKRLALSVERPEAIVYGEF